MYLLVTHNNGEEFHYERSTVEEVEDMLTNTGDIDSFEVLLIAHDGMADEDYFEDITHEF